MAIRVRCNGCRKKIAIDEAFAGGVCRCPYCRALNTVAKEAGAAAPAGPRPDRPDRPGLPAAQAAQQAKVVEAPAVIPVAKPVLIQGVVAIALIGILLGMAAFAGVMVYSHARSKQPDEVGAKDVNPITRPGARVAGMKIDAPVVYVLDGGSGTGQLFDLGAAVVRHSALALAKDDRFNVFFVSEAGVERMTEKWAGGGEAGDKLLRTFLRGRATAGATDLSGAIDQACGLKPKAVVVLAGKAPNALDAAARKAQAAGVRVYGVSLGGYGDVDAALKVLAERTGGEVRSFTESQLQGLLDDAPPLP